MKYDEKGLTLIELLVALTILAVGILALSRMLISAIAGNRFANYETAAVHLAEEKLEWMKEEAYVNLDNPPTSDGPLVVGGITFNRSWVVDRDVPVPSSTRVTVTVSWHDPSGAHQVSMTSYFSSYY